MAPMISRKKKKIGDENRVGPCVTFSKFPNRVSAEAMEIGSEGSKGDMGFDLLWFKDDHRCV